MTDEAIALMTPRMGTRAACAAAGVPQATWYRRHRISPPRPKAAPVPQTERVQPRALAPAERTAILDVLHTGRFADLAPDEVLGDAAGRGHLPRLGVHLLPGAARGRRKPGAARAGHPPRRRQARTGSRRPNQVWSWDITKLHGPAKWTYYDLYVILDIYSRYVVGWMVATCESAVLAEKLIAATCDKQGISRGQRASMPTVAPRSPPSRSRRRWPTSASPSPIRPHVSNDNPYSEAQFKTLKYRPGFPARFPSIEAARAHRQDFFPWYNNEHHHGGLGLHTAADVHYGRAAAVQAERAQVLDAAYHAHPERFVRKPPASPKLPGTSWINPPQEKEAATQ